MAYKCARDVAPVKSNKGKKKRKKTKAQKLADAFVDFKEFRIFLVMMRQYLELYAAFDAIDEGDDNRIDLQEFATSTEMLAGWGGVVEDPAATFAEIDQNGGGQILFEEFCEWALKKGLDYDSSLDAGDATAESKKIQIDDKTGGYTAYSAPKGPSSGQRKMKKGQKQDLAKFAHKLPVGRDKESSQARYKMFKSFDVSGNGQLSLAEIEAGVLSYVGEELFLMKPALKM